jgi:hypothetical protein
VKLGGPFSAKKGPPDFSAMAAWWSSKANGIDIHYKILEYLQAHYKKYVEKGEESMTLFYSEEIRMPNTIRIEDGGYRSHVLETCAGHTRRAAMPDIPRSATVTRRRGQLLPEPPPSDQLGSTPDPTVCRLAVNLFYPVVLTTPTLN